MERDPCRVGRISSELVLSLTKGTQEVCVGRGGILREVEKLGPFQLDGALKGSSPRRSAMRRPETLVTPVEFTRA